MNKKNYNNKIIQISDFPVQVTVFTSNNTLLNKSFKLKDGILNKTSNGNLINGKVDVVECHGLQGLADALKDFPQNTALALGRPHKNDHLIDSAEIVTKNNLEKNAPTGSITRSKDFFKFSDEPTLFLFDIDGFEESPEKIWEILCDIDPQLKNTGHLIVHSSSSNIYIKETDEKLKDPGGLHIYCIAKNGADIPRYGKVFAKRAWLKGHGHIKTSTAGSLLVRQIIDEAVYSPERLIFEAPPSLSENLEQRKPDPALIDGELLDTESLQDLTAREQKEYEKLIDEAKEKAKPEAEKKRKVCIQKKGNEISVQTGCNMTDGIKEAKQLIESGNLTSRCLLKFDNYGIVAVNDVLLEGEKFDNETMADPLEHNYHGGRNIAIFYWNDGKPVIHSYAHGDKVYKIIMPEPLLNIAEIYSALKHIDPVKNDYKKIGAILHSHHPGHECYKLWLDWCNKGTVDQWKGFADGESIDTLYKIAYKGGWKNNYTTEGDGIKYSTLERKRKLEKFDSEHGLILMNNGKNYIVYRECDDQNKRKSKFVPITAMEQFLEHEKVPYIETKEGNTKISAEPLFTTWKKSRFRKQYKDLKFKPIPGLIARNATLPDGDYYNLYQGLNIEPIEGDCSILLDHIEKIWCRGDEESYKYVIGWLAYMFQHPDEQGCSVVVLKSEEGAGKNIIINILTKAFGEHAFVATHPDHITGRFNDHLGRCVFLFGNEAIWGGDKSREGPLKGLITDPYITVETKYLPIYEVENCTHIMLATNNEWYAPIGRTDRRYFVLDVSNERIGDTKYFDQLNECIANGGDAALIHYLSNYDLSAFNPRAIPNNHSESKFENQLRSEDGKTNWWYECLYDGNIKFSSYPGERNVAKDWETQEIFVTNDDLFKSYSDWTDNSSYRKETKTMLTKMFNSLCPGWKERRDTGDGRKMGKFLPPLGECRKAFEIAFKNSCPPWPELSDNKSDSEYFDFDFGEDEESFVRKKPDKAQNSSEFLSHNIH